jgi:hypothetical protein
LELFGGARIVLGTSGIFSERKTGNVSQQPKCFGCFSLMKCSGPTEIFLDLTVTEKYFHE